MAEEASSDAHGAIRDLLSRLNDAWLHKSGEAMSTSLNECFADDVVIRGPDFSLAGRGRACAVRSYQDFVAQARIGKCVLGQPEIDVVGDTAAAQYTWEMTYVLAGQEYAGHGRDLFVLSRGSGQWLVVWRVMLELPDPAPPLPE